MKVFLLSFIFFLTPSSGDWGQIGHRVIGNIAEQYLSKKAKRAVQKLLHGVPLAYVSNYADDLKSDPRYDSLYNWHFINISRGKTYDPAAANPKGDLVTAITLCLEKLKASSVSKQEKALFLKLLVHFVGDLHQPMHVGHPEDRGGNGVRLKWFGSNTNLHRVWDSNMIDSYQFSATEFTESIQQVSSQQVAMWQRQPLLEWVRESQLLADQLYDNLPEGRSKEYRYRYKYFKVAKKQLLKGGVRLAGLLNDIFK